MAGAVCLHRGRNRLRVRVCWSYHNSITLIRSGDERSLTPWNASAVFLDLQNHERDIVILGPAARPFLPSCDIALDDLFRRATGGFGQHSLRLSITEHFIIYIEPFWEPITHHDDYIAIIKRELLLAPLVILHTTQGHAFDHYLFDRACTRVIDQDGRHSGYAERQTILF